MSPQRGTLQLGTRLLARKMTAARDLRFGAPHFADGPGKAQQQQPPPRARGGGGRGAWLRGRIDASGRETWYSKGGSTARGAATDDGDWEALGRMRQAASAASASAATASSSASNAGAVGGARAAGGVGASSAASASGASAGASRADGGSRTSGGRAGGGGVGVSCSGGSAGSSCGVRSPPAKASPKAAADLSPEPPASGDGSGRRRRPRSSGAGRLSGLSPASASGDTDDVASTTAATPAELSPGSDTRLGSDAEKAGDEAAGSSVEVKPSTEATSGGGAKSGRRARKGGAARAEGASRSVRISKTLTQILRHRALDVGVAIRPDGYCRLKDVLAVAWLVELECTEPDVEEVVKESDKKRFDMIEEGGERMIRAAQGHSIKVVEDERLLRRLSPEDPDLPDTCVHGTYRRHYEKIRSGGLLAGGIHGQSFRRHIHFVPFDPFDRRVISGMRFDCEVAIWIDLRRALEDGLPFYVSANQVILSPGVNGRLDTSYFLKAEDLKTGQSLDLAAPAPSPKAQAAPQGRPKAKAAK